MKATDNIKLRAGTLLSIFTLNIVVSFLCSIGVNMGFNLGHHPETLANNHTEAISAHAHSHGKHHTHDEERPVEHPKHNEQQHTNRNTDDNNCCKDTIVSLTRLDKLVPKDENQPLAILLFIKPTDLSIPSPLISSGCIKNIRQFARSYHPPISDIRIAIQSFQI